MLLLRVLKRIGDIGTSALRTVAVLAVVAAVLAFLLHPSVTDAIGIALTAMTAVLLALLPLRPAARPSAQPNPTLPDANCGGGDPEAVAAFGRDLKERLLKGRYRSVTAFADNYALTGVSRSTAYAAVSGARLPTETTTRKLLSMVVGADEQEIAAWVARRTEVESAPSGADRVAAPSAQRTVRTRDAVLLAVVVAVVTAGTSAAISTTARTSPTASAQNDCTPQADLRPRQVMAHVANTQGQGTYARLSPHTDCHTGFLPERDSVTVACQDLHGPVITDFYDGTIRHWPVWDRLSSGAYVSDLYLDLPKQTQPTLVEGISAC